MDTRFYKPFQASLFKYLILLSIIILLVADIAIYFISTSYSFKQTQNDLRLIAQHAAQGVPIVEHEKITRPDQLTSVEYKAIEKYFQEIMVGNPAIDDIYTLRPTGKPHLMSFVVSAMVTGDINGNDVIEENEVKPSIGELYNTTESPAMEKGITTVASDNSVTSDKWGQWISGYAPVRNETGNSVAVLGVDYSAEFIFQARWKIVQSLLLCDAILLPFLILLGYLLSRRISRPFALLAQGMDHVIHGDINYQLPYHGYVEDKIFSELFNNMKDVLQRQIKK